MSQSVSGNEMKTKKVWFKTFGCQMNYHDSERMLSILQDIGFDKTEEKEEADLVIFNTCAIRDLANQKFYSNLGEFKPQKKKNTDLIIAVAGCVSEVEGKQLLSRYEHLDFAFGTDSIDQLPELIHRIESGERKFFVNGFDKESDYSIETKITHGSPQAFVNIIKGCNNFCSYCIVPYTRGREKSRSVAEVVEDVKVLVEEKGITEVTLLGQNVNSFGKGRGESLTDLLDALEMITGLRRIRYTTSHPYDMSDELIEAHGRLKKLAQHLHLPAQSGSNSVLSRMNRKYTIEHYMGLLKKLRDVKPDIVLSTDIIVGFPNETEEEYQETLRFLEAAKFDFIYSYKYSARPGTKAALIEDQLTLEEKSKRLVDLQQRQLEIQEPLRKELVGKEVELLVEGSKTKQDETKWFGRSSCNRIVHFKAEQKELQWRWVKVKISEATALSCQGELIEVL